MNGIKDAIHVACAINADASYFITVDRGIIKAILSALDSAEWKTTALAEEIKAGKTPGKLVRAYRERAGMTLVDLARR